MKKSDSIRSHLAEFTLVLLVHSLIPREDYIFTKSRNERVLTNGAFCFLQRRLGDHLMYAFKPVDSLKSYSELMASWVSYGLYFPVQVMVSDRRLKSLV